MGVIKKAIIPAAGLGTRFLPATKAMPKEMLPIVDKPTIQYIVEEAIAAGIEDILLVTGKGKRAIEDHFDNAVELEQNLLARGKLEDLKKVQATAKVEIHYIRQKEALGLGHAVWCARKFIGNEPFAVLLGDDIVKNDKPCIQQLIEQFEEIQSSVIAVMQVPDKAIHKYGVIKPINTNAKLMEVSRFVEKPSLKDAPSNLAIIGRYVLTPEIFEFLEVKKMKKGEEIQLTDAIQRLNSVQKVYGYEFEGKRYDVGEKQGFIEATINFALDQKDLHDEVKNLILSKAREFTIE